MSARLGDCSASCTSALSHQCERIYAIVARAGVSPIAARRGARRRGFGRATLREPEYLHFFLCSVSDGTTPDTPKFKIKSKRNTALYVATCYDWALAGVRPRARQPTHATRARVAVGRALVTVTRAREQRRVSEVSQIVSLAVSLSRSALAPSLARGGSLAVSRRTPSHLYVFV